MIRQTERRYGDNRGRKKGSERKDAERERERAYIFKTSLRPRKKDDRCVTIM